jgi:hypothetical protein
MSLKLFRHTLLLRASAFLGLVSFAQARGQSVWSDSASLEAKVGTIARGFDKDAFVQIVLKPQEISVKIPGSSIPVKRNASSDFSMTSRYKSMVVKIFTKKQSASSEMKSAISEVLEAEGVPFSIGFHSFGANYKYPAQVEINPSADWGRRDQGRELKSILESERALAETERKKKPESAPLSEPRSGKLELSSADRTVFSDTASSLKAIKDNLILLQKNTSDQAVFSQMSWLEMKTNVYIFLSIMALIVLSIACFVFIVAARLKTLATVVAKGSVSQMGAFASFEKQSSLNDTEREGSRGSRSSYARVSAESSLGLGGGQTRQSLTGENQGSVLGSNLQTFQDLSPETLDAVLSDCYWSYVDSYARFVWRRLTPLERKSALKRLPWLSEYVSSLLSVNEEDLGGIDDPYYFSPLPLALLSNDDLLPLVRAERGLFQSLPIFRKRALELSPKERITLESFQEDVQQSRFWDVLQETAPSPHRVLASSLRIVVRSIEEEKELLPILGTIPLKIMRQSASLIWAQLLSDEKLFEVLEQFPARLLAESWIAPDEVLQRFARLLKPAKTELLKNYLAQRTASRQSDGFIEFHRRIVESLEKPLMENAS